MSEPISGQATDAAQPSPTIEDALPSLESTPYEDLDKILNEKLTTATPQEPTAQAPETTPEPSPEPPTPPAETEPAPEGEQPPEPPPEPPQSQRILPNRITTSQFTPLEQEAIALGKQLKDAGEEVPGLEERIAIVKRRHAEAAAVPQEDPDAAMAEIDAALAETEGKVDEIGKALGLEDYQAELKKRDELTARKNTLLAQKNQSEAQRVTAFESARLSSIETAKNRFPDAKDASTLLGKEVQALINEIRSDPHHPDKAVLQATNAPLFVTQTAATRLAERLAATNKTSVAKELAALMEPQQKPAPPAPAKPGEPRKAVPTAGGAASTPPVAPAQPKPFDLSSPESFDPDKLEEIMPTNAPGKYVIRK